MNFRRFVPGLCLPSFAKIREFFHPRSLPINCLPNKKSFFRQRIWFRPLLNENHENLIPKHVWLREIFYHKKICLINIHTRITSPPIKPQERIFFRPFGSSFISSFVFVDFMTAKAHRRRLSCFRGSTNERVLLYPCKVKMRM